ncbi:winged helix-turn-helix domain-containing protein [Granulicella arctica]|uniref:winged helix-turn-helix domain-containing protein n=1 Tax=Granulicella arctica TaxID=940613 RepID=UPI0021E06CF6|nr:winged helix-turn-helix domain-containing protein [Granulicella arctica]
MRKKQNENQITEDSIYQFGEFSLSQSERRLFQGTKNLLLPPRAFDALCLLVRNHSSLVSRSEMVNTLWPGVHVTEANLTNIIVRLRKLLGRDAVQTVSKYGYRFTLPVSGEPGVTQAVYTSFVRGKELAAERSLESLRYARELFWICLANDPQYAPAWAWLGRTCRLLEKFKGERSSASLAEAAFLRAFAIDPDLACAHQFFTQLQVDTGRAEQAMVRLSSRMKQRGEEPETLAGLVQVLRVCGLLRESVAAHERAIALDPTTRTSVAHTYFLLGEYAMVFETYNTGKGFYLDAAAWAALGKVDHAAALLRSRLLQPELGPLMSGLMASLLAVLEGKPDQAMDIMEGTEVLDEPEALLYFARHYALVNAPAHAVRMLHRARRGGFSTTYTLENDAAFACLRDEPEFAKELRQAALVDTVLLNISTVSK